MRKSQTHGVRVARRAILAAGAALPLVNFGRSRAFAADFSFKFATGQDPSHPVNKRAQEAIDRIKEATKGRLEIRLFPANQLGPDTHLLAQVRTGGVAFFNQASSEPPTVLPAARIAHSACASTDP